MSRLAICGRGKKGVCPLTCRYINATIEHTQWSMETHGTNLRVLAEGDPELREAAESEDRNEVGFVCSPLLLSGLVELLGLALSFRHVNTGALLTSTLGCVCGCVGGCVCVSVCA